MPSSSVLKNARVTGEVVNLLQRQGGIVVLDAAGQPIVGADRPVYSEEQMQRVRQEYQARLEASERQTREARAEGLAAGEAEGRTLERAMLRGQADALEALGGEILMARRRILASAAQDVVALAVTIAGKICRRVREADPRAAEDTLRAALEVVSGSERVVARVHPADLDLLRAQATELGRLLASEGDLQLCADEHLAPGGCLIDSPRLHIDGRLDSYLQRCAESLSQWAASEDVLTEDDVPNEDDVPSQGEDHGASAA